MRFAPEDSREEPGPVFERVWWVTTATSSAHACALTLERVHAHRKETDNLDYILCYLVDYKSVKPSLYIDLQYI